MGAVNVRGNAIYTEVEESEADLEWFERWLTSIAVRDYFGAGGRAGAEAAVPGLITSCVS
jgi:hypothetical protein